MQRTKLVWYRGRNDPILIRMPANISNRPSMARQFLDYFARQYIIHWKEILFLFLHGVIIYKIKFDSNITNMSRLWKTNLYHYEWLTNDCTASTADIDIFLASGIKRWEATANQSGNNMVTTSVGHHRAVAGQCWAIGDCRKKKIPSKWDYNRNKSQNITEIN